MTSVCVSSHGVAKARDWQSATVPGCVLVQAHVTLSLDGPSGSHQRSPYVRATGRFSLRMVATFRRHDQLHIRDHGATTSGEFSG
jgi:hypothetical protein